LGGSIFLHRTVCHSKIGRSGTTSDRLPGAKSSHNPQTLQDGGHPAQSCAVHTAAGLLSQCPVSFLLPGDLARRGATTTFGQLGAAGVFNGQLIQLPPSQRHPYVSSEKFSQDQAYRTVAGYRPAFSSALPPQMGWRLARTQRSADF